MSERESMALTINLGPHHERMIETIIAGAVIGCREPGNAAIGAALRCAAAVAEQRIKGATAVEFVGADGSRRRVEFDQLWKGPGAGT